MIGQGLYTTIATRTISTTAISTHHGIAVDAAAERNQQDLQELTPAEATEAVEILER